MLGGVPGTFHHLYFAGTTTPVMAVGASFSALEVVPLVVLRYIRPELVFSERLMKTGFWWLNAGLVLMIATSLLPIGIFQFHASLSEGLWYARSEAFLQQPFLETLRWVRTFGDVVFIVGAFAVVWQVVIGLLGSRAPKESVLAGAAAARR